jgi:hypothetical protein
MSLPPGDPRHGTVNGYRNGQCRCAACTKAATDYQREYKRNHRDPNHLNVQRAWGAPEIVEGAVLSENLRRWVVKHLADHPMTGFETRDQMGPVAYLAHYSKINIRRVQGIVNGEFPTVSLEHADAILTAAGMNDLLITGELEIKKNPRWSNEDWHQYMQERGCI